MQQDLATRLRKLAQRRPATVRRMCLVELRELAELLGPTSSAAALLAHAETMVNPQLFQMTGRPRRLVLVDATPEETLILRRWW